MRTLALACLLALPAPRPALHQDSPCPFSPRDMSAARSRIEHQAIIEGLLVNHGDDAPLEVKATALNSEGKALGDFDPVRRSIKSSGEFDHERK